jgi:hypothetical protein
VVGHRHGLQVRAPVVVHDPFGTAGGSRRVIDGEQPMLPGLTQHRWRRVRQSLFVVTTGEYPADTGRVCDCGSRVRELLRREQDRRAAVLEDVADLGNRQPDVQRHQHRTVQRDRAV